MDTPKIPPFHNIALALSGGGYRAASFHLGSMAYLHNLDLLKNVTMISTVSGGSFTGAMFAMGLQENIPFPQTYRKLVSLMEEIDLVEKGLEVLTGPSPEGYKKTNNLINSLAVVYDKKFFDGKKMGMLWGQNKQLYETIFNATEFSYGLPFRFRRSLDRNNIIGNQFLEVDEAAAKEIRIADAVASSSCFPVGFEPLVFPNDYLSVESPGLDKLRQKPEFKKGVGMMDGGITDNQGITSLLLADESASEENKIGLMIISDVSSPYMDAYTAPSDFKDSGPGSISLSWVNKINWGVTLFAAIGAVIGALFLIPALKNLLIEKAGMPPVLSWVSSGLIYSATMLVPLGLIFFLLTKLASTVREQVLPEIPNLRSSAWGFLKKISMNRYAFLIRERVKSANIMISEVFMKQIRRLIYNRVYESNQYRDRRISNLLYECTEKNLSTKKKKLESMPGDIHDFTPEMIKIADNAFSMGTTLWFDESDKASGKLRDLLTTGHFTICHNIRKYIWRTWGDKPMPEEVKKISEQAKSDWEKFRKDPYWLYKELQK